jgi:hypothetical protein
MDLGGRLAGARLVEQLIARFPRRQQLGRLARLACTVEGAP